MALETLEGVTEIDGERVSQDGTIRIDFDENMIFFRLQKGPIGEVGKNGCQVTALIETALRIIEKFNETHFCKENQETLCNLQLALMWQRERTRNRRHK